MAENEFDLVVIGSGPGGYVGAIRAAQLGLRTAIVEKDKTLGGTCLNVGCIPSKALLESSEIYAEAKKSFPKHGIKVGSVELDLAAMLKRKGDIVRQLTNGVAGLMKKNQIDVVQGTGRVVKAGEVAVQQADGERVLKTKRILIATGSVPSAIPGVELDGDRVVTSTEALSFPEVPERLVVIGAGVIGLELGSVWARLGAKVTVLEYMPRVLAGIDNEIATMAQRLFQRQGLEFKLGVRVTAAKTDGSVGRVTFTDKDGKEQVIEGDRVLVCVGRRPFTEGLGLQEAGVKLDERGRIDVDDHYRSSVEGIYAIGDVIRGPMLAHKASEEAVAAVEMMATGHGHINYDAIPNVVYTHPEVASVGRTEEELKAEGREYRKGTYPFAPNGRAKALGSTDGMVKILADAKTDRVLGAHIIGPRAGDLIAEIAVGVEFATSAEDLGRAVHAHPTLAEVIKEAALDVEKRAIHGI